MSIKFHVNPSRVQGISLKNHKCQPHGGAGEKVIASPKLLYSKAVVLNRRPLGPQEVHSQATSTVRTGNAWDTFQNKIANALPVKLFSSQMQ